MKIALLLVGFGNVARRFVQLLEESRAELAALEIEPVIVGIVTRGMGISWTVRASTRLESRNISPKAARLGRRPCLRRWSGLRDFAPRASRPAY